MLHHARELLQQLSEPFALVSYSGETLEANAAFRRLAESTGVRPRLAELFGTAGTAMLAHALRDGQAKAAVPLVVGATPRATYRLTLTRGHAPETLAALLTEVSQEVRWRDELLERDRAFTVLSDMGAALSGTIELDDLTERVYEQTRRIIPTANFYLALYDREQEIVSFPRYVEDHAWRPLKERRFANGLTEYLLRTGRPLLLPRDVRIEARRLGIEPIGRSCMAWMGAPMMADGEAIGALAVQDYVDDNCYTVHDLEILSIIAGQAAAAIKGLLLLSAARRAYDELSETQARLLETERLRSITETVGALNHEINNPLTAITGNAQLLLKHTDEMPAEARLKLETILESARRIQQVTAKMSTLIMATTTPYPGHATIIDVRRSQARDDASAVPVSNARANG